MKTFLLLLPFVSGLAYADGPVAAPIAVRRPSPPRALEVSVRAQRPRKAPYLLAGAAAGVAVASLALYATEPADATTDLSFVIGVAAVPSAVVGAGIGWLVYELRHRAAP